MNTLKITFVVRQSKKKSNGKSPIYLRITVNNRRREISTKKEIVANLWDPVRQKLKGNSPHSKALNKYLEQLKVKVHESETMILKEGKKVTAELIKQKLTKTEAPGINILKYFESHNKRILELVGKNYAMNTYKRYRTCLKHLSEFIRSNFGKDIPLMKDIDLSFVLDFEHFLKTKNNPCSHNSALKYIDHFRKVYNDAIDRGVVTINPFLRYKSKYESKDPEYLNISELITIRDKEFNIGRVERVRDVFLFCCYTGLAFTDVKKLNKQDIEQDINGNNWIVVERVKTKEPSLIMILPEPLKIIEKYTNDPETADGKLLLISGALSFFISKPFHGSSKVTMYSPSIISKFPLGISVRFTDLLFETFSELSTP